MNYKKDMLLIITIVLVLGAAIQTARTDFISNIASERRLSGEMGGNYASEHGKKLETDRTAKNRSSVFYIFYNSMKAQ